MTTETKLSISASLLRLILVCLGISGFLLWLRPPFLRQLETFVAEEYFPPNLVVDAAKGQGDIEPWWLGFAQGGEEPGKQMLAGTERPMQAISPTHIRLDHIFDDDYYGVVKREDGTLKVSWRKLDEAVESIIKMGARPFLSLSYMPSAIAPTKISKPNNWEEWQWLVEQTILHYSGEKGIAGVYYEVWNEPDLEQFGKWKYYGDQNYLTLYDYAAQGAVKAKSNSNVKPFRFGGPAITALYKNWVTELVRFTRERNLPLDFISWHRYSYDPTIFAKDVELVHSWLGENQEYELIISEWGPDPGKTEAYASSFSAAHAVTTVRQILKQVDKAFAFEVKDGPDQGNFGWGILTYGNYIPKPRYKAFIFMRDMSGQRLQLTGEGSAVTAWAVKEGNEIRVVASNYSLGEMKPESVPLTFTNLSPGQYRLQWEFLQGGGDERVVAVATSPGSVSQTVSLQPHDVVKFRLRKVEPVGKIDPGNPSGFGKILLTE